MNDNPGSLKFAPQHNGRKRSPGSEFLEFEHSMRKTTSSTSYFSSANELKRLLSEQKKKKKNAAYKKKLSGC